MESARGGVISPSCLRMIPLRCWLLLTALLFLSSTLAAEVCSGLEEIEMVTGFPEPRVALVVGNSAYQSPLSPLPNAVNDAEDLARLLRQLGFEVICGLNLNRDEMMHLLDRLQRATDRLNSSAVSLFYYAGHGAQIAGENYIIPLATRLRQPESFESEVINLDRVMQGMTRARNHEGSRFLILDACRDNPLGEGWGQPTPDYRSRGLYWVFGTGYNSYAWDGGGRNGLFTRQLLAHLPTPGATFEQVLKKVTAAVDFESGGRQVPETGGSLIRDFSFIPGDAVVIETVYQIPPLWLEWLPLLAVVLLPPLFWLLFRSWRGWRQGGGGLKLSWRSVVRNGLLLILFLLALAVILYTPPLESPAPETGGGEEAVQEAAKEDEAKVLLFGPERQLALCQIHLRANRLVGAMGGDALECYHTVLEHDPENLTALAGVNTIIDRLAEMALAAITAGREGEGGRLLDQMRQVNPRSGRIAEVELKLEQQQALIGVMMTVEGGCFLSGSPSYETGRQRDELQKRHCVDDFEIATTEVTQGQWQAVMGENPAHYRGSSALPLEGISWLEAQQF
ncbi:MAG: caspase family protein, partial [Gammaproteobacteria bacterium]|nr:caspase family protein [Gammaproteobacteria bacterium]